MVVAAGLCSTAGNALANSIRVTEKLGFFSCPLVLDGFGAFFHLEYRRADSC